MESTAATFDMVILLALSESQTEIEHNFYLIPSEKITKEIQLLFEMATLFKRLGSKKFTARDSILFPEDSEEEKERKRRKRNYLSIKTVTEENQQMEYAQTHEEAYKNKSSFEIATDSLQTGEFKSYKVDPIACKNVFIRQTFRWKYG